MSQDLSEIKFNNTWTQAALAMYGAIQYTAKKELTLVDVMGYTSHAFRIKIDAETVNIAGPTEFDWSTILSQGLQNLGFSTKHVGEPNFIPPGPDLLVKAVKLVQESIDQGIPALAWDLFVPEFGLIHGYDDERQVFHAKDISQEGELPYDKLGRGEIGELFVLSLAEAAEIDRYSSLSGALKMILEHAQQREAFGRPSFQNGLAAYDAWMNAFQQGQVDPLGNSYNVQLVSCARDYAWKFLDNLTQHWTGQTELDQSIHTLTGEAAQHYEEVSAALQPLTSMFPFPHGNEPNNPEIAKKTIQQLQLAKAAEEKGITKLQKLYTLLS